MRFLVGIKVCRSELVSVTAHRTPVVLVGHPKYIIQAAAIVFGLNLRFKKSIRMNFLHVDDFFDRPFDENANLGRIRNKGTDNKLLVVGQAMRTEKLMRSVVAQFNNLVQLIVHRIAPGVARGTTRIISLLGHKVVMI